MPKSKMDFEASLSRIIDISNTLENEEMKLEEAMNLYKEAITLITGCQSKVDKAEREIYIYREKNQENSAEKNQNNNKKKEPNKQSEKSSKTQTEKVDNSFELFGDLDKL